MGFWPNSNEETHHRSSEFRHCYQSIQSKLRVLFALSEVDWDVLLIPLNGSLAIESLIRTFGGTVNVRTDGSFSDRVARVHHHLQSSWSFGVLHETNDSRCCDVSDCDFVDAVSALPYFDFPHHAQAVVTVSSKQFGAETIWSVVMVRRDFWKNAQPLEGYLDLRRYKDFSKIFETPCTPPISALFSFEQSLQGFDISVFRSKIDHRYMMLKEKVLQLGGEVKGGPPGFTFRLPDHLKIEPSQFWVPPGGKGWLQAFLWSGSDVEHEYLLASLTEMSDQQQFDRQQ